MQVLASSGVAPATPEHSRLGARLPPALPGDAGQRVRHLSRCGRAQRRRLRPDGLAARGSPRCCSSSSCRSSSIGLTLGPLVDRLSRRGLMVGLGPGAVRRLLPAPVRDRTADGRRARGGRRRRDRVLPPGRLRGSAEPRPRRPAADRQLAAAGGREHRVDGRPGARRRPARDLRAGPRVLDQRRRRSSSPPRCCCASRPPGSAPSSR